MTENPKISRVTIDIDGHHAGWQLRAIQTYHNLYAVGAHTVDVRISSSGEGIHLFGWFGHRLSGDEKQRLREQLGDDPNRVHMDELRGRVGHTTQVSWTDKGTREGTADDDFATIYDALEHIQSSTRTDYERIHAFANHGRKAIYEFRGFTHSNQAEVRSN